MVDRESAREQVRALVEKFRALPAAKRKEASEQETRLHFILPLFRALGWDDSNPGEVSAEEQISRGFVDFGYYLNGVPAFYLETKKSHSKLNNKDNMKQATNYAYLKGVTWAVLSNFEGLMVFNAEWEESDPLKTRFLDLRWEHYASDDFEKLWLLSKPAMQTREIDRIAEEYGRKAKKEPVTKTLFDDLTKWRHELFNDIYLMKTTLWASDPRKVDNAVQKLLDRLIFIRSVEDRGVEMNRLLPLLRQSKRSELPPNLMKLFRELDGIYNSNLFAESELDMMELHDTNLLEGILNGLYKAPGGFVTYDFNAISADVLGAVYEQYLGFRAQDPEAKQKVDKRQKRKSQGIYYTPQFVVKYIVGQTVGRLLVSTADKGLSSDEGLISDKGFLSDEGLISDKGLKPLVSEKQTGEQKLLPAEDVFKLRILDPACGSGSFLIEAFDVLDRHLGRLHPAATPAERREWRRRILTECLYGVDLDDQAVEVTRLNLMLRAAQEQGKLPLLTHIQHGNSLIDDLAVAGETAFAWEKRFPLVFAGKTRQLWFVTFVTHNSRVSERMVTYGVESGEPLIFTPEEQIEMAEQIAEACRRYQIPIVAWNVLPDHVHMIIAAEDEKTLNETVRKIKGYSSYAFKRGQHEDKGLKPLVSRDEMPLVSTDETPLVGVTSRFGETATLEDGPVWAQKFNRMPITDDAMLYDVREYINTNHEKHAERWGDSLQQVWAEGIRDKGLKPLVQIVEAVCWPVDDAIHERGGFDVVIGNPPYVRQEMLGAAFKTFAEQQYETYAGAADLYVYFIEKGIKLLRSGGIYGVIVANKWMRAGYGKALRRWLQKQPVEEIVDFGDLPVFEEATTYPCILMVGKDREQHESKGRNQDKGLKPLVSGRQSVISDSQMRVTQVKTLDFGGLKEYIQEHEYTVERESLDENGWSLAGADAGAILEKIKAAGVPLGEYINGKIYYGIKTGYNDAFLIDGQTRTQLIREDPKSAEVIKPFLMGRDVKRYEVPTAERYVILMPNGWTDRTRGVTEATATETGGANEATATETRGLTAITEIETRGLSPLSKGDAGWQWLQKQYPAIANYLRPFENQAAKRWDKGQYWWELRACDYYDEFEKPKILYPDLSQRGNFMFDINGGYYCGNTIYFLPSDDLYLLGLLNSRLTTLFCKNSFSNYRGGYIRFFQEYVKNLPIRQINFDDSTDKAHHDRMVELVGEMLRLKQEHAAAEAALDDRRHWLAEEIERTDKAIDTLVYDLYGLTEDERRVVG